MRKIIFILTLMLLTVLSAADAHAGQSGGIHVDISTSDGKTVAVLEHQPIHSSIPVIFTPDKITENIYYSISIDDGVNFGGYAKMEDGSITLYPDDKTAPQGRWMIRFLAMSDEGGEMLSDTFAVQFDTSAPQIKLADEDSYDGWVTAGDKPHLTFSDDGSGIGRIVVKNGETVIREEHFSDDDVQGIFDMDLEVKETDKAVNDIEVICTDLAGNSMVMTFTYRYDNTAPDIRAEGIENGKCMTEGGRIDVTASDNSGEVYIDWSVEREIGDEIITTGTSNVRDFATIRFDEDGRYTVRMSATDGAKNRSKEIKREFVIDHNAPAIDISGCYDNVDQRSPVSVLIDVYDEMYEGTSVDINILRSTMGKSDHILIQNYDLQAMSDSRSVDISTDGDYVINVRARDAAGNASEMTRRFRLDATSPNVAIFGIDEGEYTSAEPVVRFSAAEMFYDSTVMTAVLEKKEGAGYVPVSTDRQVMKDIRDHMDINCKKEGQYRLTCSASDRTGNRADSSVEFTVDHTPPVIAGISGIDNSFFRSFALPGKLSDMVRDSFGARSVAYVNDEEFGDNDVIISEGKYILSIIARDQAGNVSEGSAAFVVDHTSPQIVLSGFDRNGNIKKGSIVTVGLADERDRLLSVRFNDRNIVVGKDNTAIIAVNEYGEYSLEVKAEDDAENVTDTVIHTSCYAGENPITGYLRSERKYVSEIVNNDKNDIDFANLAIGLVSVLSGTYGLAYRTVLRH